MTDENIEFLKNDPTRKESTRVREGYFMAFAELARREIGDRLPLMYVGAAGRVPVATGIPHAHMHWCGWVVSAGSPAGSVQRMV